MRTHATLGEVVAVGRDQLYLAIVKEIQDVLFQLKPHIIVNAAAYTAVDMAESEVVLAMRINAEALKVLASTAAELVHYSTDYVFGGYSTFPYREQDMPSLHRVYSHSKLLGIKAIIKSGCDYLILRTSWVYGFRGSNFLHAIIRNAQERVTLNVVDDQYGSPILSRTIADVTAHIIREMGWLRTRGYTISHHQA